MRLRPQRGRASRETVPEPITIRVALMFSSAQQYTHFLITFPSIMILSRLLTPAQIGVYSVAVAFINLVHMLRDFGTTEYLVQVEPLDQAAKRSAFTVTLIIAWVLAVLLFLASPYIADLFREQGLTTVVRILSINYLLLPIGSTTGALLAREMQFGIRYKINITAAIVQNGVTILLAWCGWGYYSPAWGAVCGMVATVAGCLYWGRRYRVRGVGLENWRHVAQFGWKNTVGTMMSQAGEAAPDFVIGRMLGFVDVGMFSRGYGLVRMFNENISGAIGAVSYSAFSRQHRDGGEAGTLFLRSLTYITGVGWPFLGFASLMSFPIIRIFFGDQWDAAAPILRFLAISSAMALLVLQYQNFLTAVGRVGLATLWMTAWQMLTITALICGAYFSLVAVAAALVPATALAVAGVVTGLVTCTDITARDYVLALGPSFVVAVCALAPVLLLRVCWTPVPGDLWAPLICAGAVLTVGAMFGAWLADHPLWHEARRLRKRRGVLGADTGDP
ncbi:lipopolysaccharide biosynthesis protein [Salinisphaera sp. SWV1]|uniref:lipopolysaccharide biosynthesis protein n=1 Tax=Salinisphaera sp. SWV1 TaxID=3454139 RepID=UPI003F82FA53